ncbi:MAG: DUF1549 and DUF1553 domain-containing protein [Pirellulales bacterium]
MTHRPTRRRLPRSIKLSTPCLLVAVLSAFAFALPAFAARAQSLEVFPPQITLDRPEASCQVVVTHLENGERRDVTRQSQFTLVAPQLAAIQPTGLLAPLAEGSTQLIIRFQQLEQRIPVLITQLAQPPPVSFEHEVLPVLTKARCNSGGCHGKAEGQAGFKLSLFGFDPAADYDAIVHAGRGRRLSLASPERSLLLLKGAAQLPHGGGLKLEVDSPGHQRLLRWISAGAPRTSAGERPVVRIEVTPADLRLAPNSEYQLHVDAIDAAGQRRCVTAEAEFISNAPYIADVSTTGLLHATDVPGDAALLVRYQGHVAVARVVLPRPRSSVPRLPEANFIDQHVAQKLEQLGIAPSPLIDDATYLRRVCLDLLGTLPTADEARRFLDDSRPDKRRRLVDELLDRPEYARYWAMKWSNLLRADKIKITPQATVGLTRWLQQQFTINRPYDELVHEILTAQGPIQSESPAAFFKALDQPELAGRSVSQLFLGVRIECAQCHHHPSERWSQDDYAGFVGFFTGLAVKKLPEGAEAITTKPGVDAKHPRTGELIPARVLGGETADFTAVRDRRRPLADWVCSHDNPYFARAIANRLWAHYLGRGLVEPIDDLRATNPATNERLLDALAAHLREHRYDLKDFTRVILASNTYQLSDVPNDSNRDDRQHFSHAYPKALPAEVLLDAVCQATGVPEKFNGWPVGIRAIDVWDNRMPSYFLRIFGRPVRATVCECERSNEPSISQALHLLNSPEIQAKIAHRDGLARRLADSDLTPEQIIDELSLVVLARRADSAELTLLAEAFRPVETASEPAPVVRRQAVEDILWSLLNSKEFLYIH